MKQIVKIPSGPWTLHGIVHLPHISVRRRVGLLVPANTNKFGPHRILLQVADAAAVNGFYALRCDYRGTCDSPGVSKLTFADQVADQRAAVAYFRREYQLDAVLGWGLCKGAAVVLHGHAAGRRPEERLDGII